MLTCLGGPLPRPQSVLRRPSVRFSSDSALPSVEVSLSRLRGRISSCRLRAWRVVLIIQLSWSSCRLFVLILLGCVIISDARLCQSFPLLLRASSSLHGRSMDSTSPAAARLGSPLRLSAQCIPSLASDIILSFSLVVPQLLRRHSVSLSIRSGDVPFNHVFHTSSLNY